MLLCSALAGADTLPAAVHVAIGRLQFQHVPMVAVRGQYITTVHAILQVMLMATCEGIRAWLFSQRLNHTTAVGA